MTETGPWETDWIVISSEEATGQASLFVYFPGADLDRVIRFGKPGQIL